MNCSFLSFLPFRHDNLLSSCKKKIVSALNCSNITFDETFRLRNHQSSRTSQIWKDCLTNFVSCFSAWPARLLLKRKEDLLKNRISFDGIDMLLLESKVKAALCDHFGITVYSLTCVQPPPLRPQNRSR